MIHGHAVICGDVKVCGNPVICDNIFIQSDNDYVTVRGLDSEYRNATVFKTKNKNIAVECGYFYGTLAEFTEFANKLKETHGNGNSKFAKEYLMLIELIKVRFELEN